jgi:hypothetical protein
MEIEPTVRPNSQRQKLHLLTKKQASADDHTPFIFELKSINIQPCLFLIIKLSSKTFT